MGWSVARQRACVLPLCLVRCYMLANYFQLYRLLYKMHVADSNVNCGWNLIGTRLVLHSKKAFTNHCGQPPLHCAVMAAQMVSQKLAAWVPRSEHVVASERAGTE